MGPRAEMKGGVCLAALRGSGYPRLRLLNQEINCPALLQPGQLPRPPALLLKTSLGKTTNKLRKIVKKMEKKADS